MTVVAFGVLVGMRMTTSGAEAAAVSPETQQFMADFQSRIANLDKMDPDDPLNPANIKSMFESTASIVAAIEDDPTVKQVPLDQVQMNPFTPVHAKKVVEVEIVDNIEAQRSARLRELYGELARVEVQSLVGGNRARAFIGGDLYKVGDTLGSFTVVSIDNRKVVFDVPDFELRDDETAVCSWACPGGVDRRSAVDRGAGGERTPGSIATTGRKSDGRLMQTITTPTIRPTCPSRRLGGPDGPLAARRPPPSR